MKVDLEYRYLIDYKRPRHPSWSHDQISDITTIDFRDVNPSDAPVCFVLKDKATSNNEAEKYYPNNKYVYDYKSPPKSFVSPDEECIIRIHNGEFYASRFNVSEINKYRNDHTYDPFDAEVVIENGKISTKNANGLYAGGQSEKKSASDFERENPNAKRVNSNKEIFQKGLRKVCDRFCVIDNVIYEKVYEPTIIVSIDKAKQTVVTFEEAISQEIHDVKKNQNVFSPENKVRFGIDEYDKALEFAKHISDYSDKSLAVDVDVEVIDTSAVGFRGDHEALFMSAQEVIKFMEKFIDNLSADLVISTVDCAHKLSIHDRLTKTSLNAVRKMNDNLVSFVSNLDRNKEVDSGDFNHNYQQLNYVTGLITLQEVLSQSLRRWDNRSDDHLDWFDHTLDALPSIDYPKRAFEITSMIELQSILLNWEGEFPIDISSIDKVENGIFVVTDLETRIPSSIHIYPRHDLDQASDIIFQDAVTDEAKDIELMREFIESDRNYSIQSMANNGASNPAISSSFG